MQNAENTVSADKKVYKSPFNGWNKFDVSTVNTYYNYNKYPNYKWQPRHYIRYISNK